MGEGCALQRDVLQTRQAQISGEGRNGEMMMDHAAAALERLNEALTRVDFAICEAFTANTLEDLPPLRYNPLT
jgi:hypothetical protein